ncbi:uncharacterized protein Dana_GF21007 [Drosophila ananassae]|uniref:N-terminal methionine N(alpha)-acetyltransferase NatC n=1 Tax=Drosophila ananassae TaxID=7217 RepID=B3MRE9_DROAN|nr:N-alpha-acetyltransferase 30A [Drosophila ananassae]XP_032308471.1 N-alpha-acetyltransferase 30A [Drosophila ananassae]XP_032308472.1 N-alpha-acetyltransferase 30A [Drosophila ananassae]EDV34354.1 uncharacterized protein Dana_GF21007 [Drosophila ananassae]
MADAQAAAPAALTASKKKFKNKKKTDKLEKSLEPQPSSNGHAPGAGSEPELNGLLQQLHLCNGHSSGAVKEQPQQEATDDEAATPLTVLNGHHSNNNHIRCSSSIKSSSHNNNVDSSNNNSKRRDHLQQQERPITATSKTTANTQTTTTTATATKTTAAEAATMETTGSSQAKEPVEHLPSTSAEAVAIPAEPQQPEPAISADEIVYKEYEAEHQMHDIMRLIQAELSEPYSIYTYRYFIYNWPKLCFLASHDNQYVGAIVCKLDMHMNVRRGYIAMLAVRKEYRKLKIGTTLVTKAIEAMLADNADEVVLETEMRNEPALRLYENLGFVRDKRLFRYYLNGVDALRLKLWFR